MNYTKAAKILETLARMEPDYDALSEEYGAAAEDLCGELPPDFPEQALNLLRTDPDMAEQIDMYDSLFSISASPHTGYTDLFDVADILTPGLIVSVIVLLSVHFNFQFSTKLDKNTKLTVEGGYTQLNPKVIQSLSSIFGGLISAAGKAEEDLSETPDEHTDTEQDT